MKTAVSIPNPIFKAAERAAKRAKISRSRLYARALEDFLERQKSKGITEALNEVYSTESSELDPDLKQAAYDLLSREKW